MYFLPNFLVDLKLSHQEYLQMILDQPSHFRIKFVNSVSVVVKLFITTPDLVDEVF